MIEYLLFNFHCRLYGAFTMDVIARCGFGLKLDSQKNKDDPFVKNAKKLFNFSTTSPIAILAGKLGTINSAKEQMPCHHRVCTMMVIIIHSSHTALYHTQGSLKAFIIFPTRHAELYLKY